MKICKSVAAFQSRTLKFVIICRFLLSAASGRLRILLDALEIESEIVYHNE